MLYVRLPALVLVGMLVLFGSLAGCGGSSSGSKTNSSVVRSASTAASAATTAAHHAFAQAEAPALASCRRAVAQEASVEAGAKPEISALCDRINDVIEDNEGTVRAVCQELANASSSSGSLARKRVYSACYAEYAKTIR